MQSSVSTLDGIIDTVTGFHPLLPLLGLLKYNGKLVIVGGPDKLELPVPPLLFGEQINHDYSKLRRLKKEDEKILNLES